MSAVRRRTRQAARRTTTALQERRLIQPDHDGRRVAAKPARRSKFSETQVIRRAADLKSSDRLGANADRRAPYTLRLDAFVGDAPECNVVTSRRWTPAASAGKNVTHATNSGTRMKSIVVPAVLSVMSVGALMPVGASAQQGDA